MKMIDLGGATHLDVNEGTDGQDQHYIQDLGGGPKLRVEVGPGPQGLGPCDRRRPWGAHDALKARLANPNTNI